MYSNEVPPVLISHIQHVTTHCSCLCRAMKKIQTECLPVFTVNQKYSFAVTYWKSYELLYLQRETKINVCTHTMVLYD